MIRHFFSIQFLSFLGVGGIAALLNWLSRIILSLWLPFSIAVMVAYCFGMSAAFVLNRTYVFPKSGRPVRKQVRDFVLTNLAFLPIVWLAALYLNRWLTGLGMQLHSEELAHAAAIALPMFATFIIYKFIAFKADQT